LWIGNSGRQSGFSLLEVIVALAVLGICVSVILRIFSSVAGATRIIDDYAEALNIAESQMALQVARDNPLGTDSGLVDNYYRWNTKVTEFRLDTDSPLLGNSGFSDAENSYIPFYYRVTVVWGDIKKRELELATIRLGVRP